MFSNVCFITLDTLFTFKGTIPFSYNFIEVFRFSRYEKCHIKNFNLLNLIGLTKFNNHKYSRIPLGGHRSEQHLNIEDVLNESS